MAAILAASAWTTREAPGELWRGGGHGPGQRSRERAIDFDGDDPARIGQEGQGERAEPGAHLEDHIVR